MKQRLGSLLFGLLLAAGCADATFELIPPPASDSAAQAGMGPSSGGSAGTAATGGLGAASGVSGSAGSGFPPTDGGPEPSDPCMYDPSPDCRPCMEESKCTGTDAPYCGAFSSKCVPCRYGYDCPLGVNCTDDCPKGQLCAWEPTPHCGIDCQTSGCDPDSPFPFCNLRNGGVCSECDPDPRSSLNKHCAPGLVCHSAFGTCVECNSAFDCVDLTCNPFTSECQPCKRDDECGPTRSCDDGRCFPPINNNP